MTDVRKHNKLHRQDLEFIKCPDPLCEGDHPIGIMQSCHIDAGLLIYYDKTGGCLNVHCKKCASMIIKIAVEEATVQ